MADDHRTVYQALLEASEQGIPSALATILSTSGSVPRHAGSKMLVYSNGRIVGTIGGGKMESEAINTAQEVIRTGEARTETYTLNSIANGDPGICGGTATIFIEPIVIPATLLVIGGGHVGKALAELAKWMGYRVVLSDDRDAYCNESYISGLDGYIVTKPEFITQEFKITSYTYIAITSRGLPIDEKLLPILVESDAAYIGLIGSRRRWAITAKTLREQYGLSEEQLKRIHAPIGLELEAESPKEIALSIMAEITMLRHGGTGQAMQWHGQVHDLE